jgi:acyl-coenzyme A synthetase/AMP-(fatty) acid ligase/acyl carrier protein
MVSHGNLVYNCGVMQENWGLSEETIAVTWLPHFHDMGLIEGLLNPLYAGFPVVFMPPAQFVARPVLWLQLITRFRATHSGAPNFAYDLCAKRVSDEQLSELDLSCWTVAYSGAEPVRSETMDRFAGRFGACGFQHQAFSPCYGLAEATLMVSGSLKTEPPIVMDVDAARLERGGIATPAAGVKSRRLAGSGHPRRGTRLLIVDPETRRACPEGTVGEIWVMGPTLAHGYWKQSEESLGTFNAFVSDTGDGPCLRTGDLGFLAGTELFVTGRSKDLIIVRGANFYPQDIEAVAERAHPALRLGGGVAFSIEIDNTECIVVGHELDRTFRNVDHEELERIAFAIRRAVSEELDLEVYAVQLLKIGSVQKTCCGKIQRQACRADFLDGRSEPLFESRLPMLARAEKVDELIREELLALSPGERRFVLEERMRKHVARVLQMHWRHIDPSEPLGSYGLESLKGYQLIAQLEDSLGITIPATTIYNYPSLDGLSRYIAGLLEIEMDNPRNSSAGAHIAPVRAFEDESAAEILRAVENISVSELEEIIADKRSRGAEEPARGKQP